MWTQLLAMAITQNLYYKMYNDAHVGCRASGSDEVMSSPITRLREVELGLPTRQATIEVTRFIQ